MKYILVLWTCKDIQEARRIAKLLIEKQLVACASIIPLVESIYRWEDKLEKAEECKVFLKTAESCFTALQELIIQECSYEVPEILQIAIERGNPAYLKWIQSELHSIG